MSLREETLTIKLWHSVPSLAGIFIWHLVQELWSAKQTRLLLSTFWLRCPEHLFHVSGGPLSESSFHFHSVSPVGHECGWCTISMVVSGGSSRSQTPIHRPSTTRTEPPSTSWLKHWLLSSHTMEFTPVHSDTDNSVNACSIQCCWQRASQSQRCSCEKKGHVSTDSQCVQDNA